MIAGNQLWRLRKTCGKPKKFKTPAALWKAACAYFKWIEDNPIWEQQLVTNRGEYTRVNVPHMHAMTIVGLCLHMGTTKSTYRSYRTKEGYEDVCKKIDAIIYEQKFAGAAANMLNHSIIARDLGLKEKAEITGSNGDPIKWQVEFVDADRKDSSTEKD